MQYLNVKIKGPLMERLNAYAEDSTVCKWKIVEVALTKHLDEVAPAAQLEKKNFWETKT